MFKPLSLYIGLRYSRAKRRNHFISFISLISIGSIALGITTLITVLSVMNGFEKELRDRVLGMTAHATISASRGGMSDWQQASQLASEHPRVVASAPFINREAMLINGQQVNGAMIRGVIPDQERTVSVLGEPDKMLEGSLDELQPGSFNIILGRSLARTLNVWPGDKVTVVSPTVNSGPAGTAPRMKRFTVVGRFDVDYDMYDSGVALVNMADAQKLFRMEGEVTGVQLMLDDLYIAPVVAEELALQLQDRYWVRDWSQYHANFFRAINQEKTVTFIILLLIVAVAAFNIVSTLVMVVTDKQADIAILRTLGASPRMVMAVFFTQGTLIGVLGTLLGMIGGVSLAMNVDVVLPFLEKTFGFNLFPSDIYYISDIRGDVHWPDVLQICGYSFLIAMVATLYPSWRAARVQPAEALRYE